MPVMSFSLVEMIGVLAVVVILAGAIFWAAIKSIDQAFRVEETRNLQSFSANLQSSILRNRHIPGGTDTNTWYKAIAEESGLSTNLVLRNRRGASRVFLIHPGFQIGTNTPGALPYSQGNEGSPTQPVNARLMILSSLSVPLDRGTNAANFDALWNTADGTLPANGSFAGWKGLPEDLRIERINLSPLFVHLQLSNVLSTNQGRYSIDGRTPTNVLDNIGVDSFFLQNSILRLYKGTSSGGSLDATMMLGRDGAFFYVAQVWRDVPYVPQVPSTQYNTDAAALAQMITMAARMFAASPYNTHASGGATPPTVLNAMSNFMYHYVPYAALSNFPTSGTLYNNAKAAQTTLYNAFNNLSDGISEGGCTNGP